MPVYSSSVVLLVYGAAHCIVDACCAAAVFAAVAQGDLSAGRIAALLLLYNALAFGLEAPFGLAVDILGKPRLAAIAGCLVCAGAFLLTSSPTATAVVAGVGNALFHVGGGSICLRATPHRATGPGIFVAPGSVGILLGTILGRQGLWISLPLIPIALLVCVLMARSAVPPGTRLPTAPKFAGRVELVVALLMLPIVVRSLLGSIAHFPWTTHPGLLLGLTTAVVLGKFLGGIFADRWGWARVGVGSILASMPFLTCAPATPLAALPGVFFISVSTSITLAAIAESLPGFPAFAFGLTCTAILLGIVPGMLGQSPDNPILVSLAIVVSAAALYRGLRLMSPNDLSLEPCRCKNEMA
jgi:FSR family fosmidomycin resistance protein-like MFS transporter